MPRRKRNRYQAPADLTDRVAVVELLERLPKQDVEPRSMARRLVNKLTAQEFQSREERVQELWPLADSEEERRFLEYTGRLPELDEELDRTTREAEDERRAAEVQETPALVQATPAEEVRVAESQQLLHAPHDIKSRWCWAAAIAAVTGMTERKIYRAFEEFHQAREALRLPSCENPDGIPAYGLSPIMYRLTGEYYPLQRVPVTDTFFGETSSTFAERANDGIYLVGGYSHLWALAVQGRNILESAANSTLQFMDADTARSHPYGDEKWWLGHYPINYPPITEYYCVGDAVPLQRRRAEWAERYSQPVPLEAIVDESFRSYHKPASERVR